jgi:outer membrane receptor protein involved in Fe transport
MIQRLQYFKRGVEAILLPLLLMVVAVGNPMRAADLPETDPSGATLNGYVIDASTQETLIAATVVVKGTKLGALTNKSGFFAIRSIPPGKQTVVISLLGYARRDTVMEFTEGKALELRIALTPGSVQGRDVVIEGDRDVQKREITISRIDVPMKQLSQLRIGGEADVFRSLQYLPGVLTSSQVSSGLFIRGGSPDQNLVLLDGSTVYNPSHLFGFFSTFNPDAIKDVDLVKGGFPAEYGGRLSAVIDLTQKDGNRNEFEGVASLGAISSRLSLQGPIGNGSWFIGGRRTYLDLLLGLLPEDKENPLPSFNFYDVNAKISQTVFGRDKIFLSGFASQDKLGLTNSGLSFDIGIGNRAGSAGWNHIFGDDLFSNVVFSATQYRNGFDGNNAGFQFKVENIITDYTGKGSIEWFATDGLTLKAGFEGTHYVFDYEKNFSGSTDSSAQKGTNEGSQTNLTIKDDSYAGYGQVNYQLTELFALQGGVRVDHSRVAKATTVDPRLALRYQIQDNVALKAAWGIYHQYLRLASQLDFSFFDTWLPSDTSVVPSKAEHYILGIETKPFEGYSLNADLYYKKLYNISEFNQYALGGKKVSDIFFSGNGDAYGVEIFLQKKAGDLTGWLGYAYGVVNARFDSINNGNSFHPKYDRRHDLKIVAQYKLNDRWEIGASFTLQSGQPYTGATSRFQTGLPGESDGSDITVPTDRYSLRLPMSHQLNLNVNYNTTFFGLPARLLIDIFNVYSHRDIWFRYYDASKSITEVTDVRLLPIIPTVSFEVKF